METLLWTATNVYGIKSTKNNTICAENDALNLTHIHKLSKTLWQIVQNSAKTVSFHKIPTSENQVKFQYFMQK